ncbi:MAG: ATP synthase F0 subunit C [Myxococcota bacterium]
MKNLIKWIPALLVVAVAVLIANPAFAADTDPNMWRSGVGIGIGIAMGLAVLGGALGQGMAASSMFQAVARNPAAAGKLNAPFFVGMALIESLVIFGWVMVFIVQGSMFNLG